MFDIKASVSTAITTQISAGTFRGVDRVAIAETTELCDNLVRGGKVPIDQSDEVATVIMLGDLRTKREWFSRGYNRIEMDLDILHYWRKPISSSYFYETAIEQVLQYYLTGHALGQTEATITKLRESDIPVNIHDNIWRLRFVLNVITYEATTP